MPARTVTRRRLLAGTGGVAAAGLLAACDVSADPGNRPRVTAPPPIGGDRPEITVGRLGDVVGDFAVHTLEIEGEGSEDFDVFAGPVQTAIEDTMGGLRGSDGITAATPLAVLDPHRFNATGLHVFFPDEADGTLTCVVRTENCSPFTTTPPLEREHGVEAHVIGLVPGARSELTLTWAPAGGDPMVSRIMVIPPGTRSAFGSATQRRLEGAADAISDGLFALLSINGLTATPLVDAEGTVRAELTSHTYRIDEADGNLVLGPHLTGYGVHAFDALGRPVAHWPADGIGVHHDLLTPGDGFLYLLSGDENADSVEDAVHVVDLATGQRRQLFSLGDLLPEYKKLTAWDDYSESWDWVHLNSIDVHGTTAYLSARETSSVIAIDDIHTGPSLRWIIGEPGVWAGTPYEQFVLDRVGDFRFQTGQHTVVRHDDGLPAGQFHLELFNNEYWRMASRDYDGPIPEGAAGHVRFPDAFDDTSSMYRYLVDEGAGTVELVASFDVPHSSVVSSVQRWAGNYVVCSGRAEVWGEYTAAGELIAQYRLDTGSEVYRVQKIPVPSA